MISPDQMRFVTGKVVRNDGHGPIFYRMTVSLPDPVTFSPGQFAMVSGWRGDDPLLPRPLAIFRAEKVRGKGTVEFVYKVVGRGTALLSGLHPGDAVSLTLPLGRGFAMGREGREYWLLGGGVGFSSIFPAAAALLAGGVAFDLYLGARTREELPPKEWTPGASLPGRLHACTDDGTAGYHGRVTDAVVERLSRLPPATLARLAILACGPREMLRTISLHAGTLGVEVQVALENRMACGFGVCWGCVVALREGDKVNYRRVCREGPVFDAKEVVW